MGTATVFPPPAQTAPGPSTDATVTDFLTGWAVTVLPLLAAMLAFEAGWTLLDTDTWPTAAAFVAASAVVSAAWLRRRGWPARTVLTAVAGAAAVLAPLVASGQVSPAGLALWWPVSTVLAAALELAAQPLTLTRSTDLPQCHPWTADRSSRSAWRTRRQPWW